MARIPTLVLALTAGAVLAASPLASATGNAPPPAAPEMQAPGVSMCGERDQVVAELAQVFKERPMAVGQVDGSAVVEIFASSETGSWTILATGTDGTSCIISAGEGFESVTPVRGVDA